jgi:hypothetical protein
MAFKGQQLPHRTIRGLAMEKGTTPAGFEGMAYPEGKDAGGPAAITKGWSDAAAVLGTPAGAVVSSGKQFTVTGGKR